MNELGNSVIRKFKTKKKKGKRVKEKGVSISPFFIAFSLSDDKSKKKKENLVRFSSTCADYFICTTLGTFIFRYIFHLCSECWFILVDGRKYKLQNMLLNRNVAKDV